jgi:hypothetical protein
MVSRALSLLGLDPKLRANCSADAKRGVWVEGGGVASLTEETHNLVRELSARVKQVGARDGGNLPRLLPGQPIGVEDREGARKLVRGCTVWVAIGLAAEASWLGFLSFLLVRILL